jgi:hypothetical protein
MMNIETCGRLRQAPSATRSFRHAATTQTRMLSKVPLRRPFNQFLAKRMKAGGVV